MEKFWYIFFVWNTQAIGNTWGGCDRTNTSVQSAFEEIQHTICDLPSKLPLKSFVMGKKIVERNL